MATVDIESQEFFELVTDALRAGPGSPQWHQAVRLLRPGTSGAQDDYALLYAAREHLESGRRYREVRAGAGFTRKLMDGINKEKQALSPKASTAGIIAVVAGIVFLTLVGIGIWVLIPSGAKSRSSVEELANQVMVTPIVSTTFNGRIPADWHTVGKLPLIADHGLTASPSVKSSPTYLGGAIVSANPIPADQAFTVDVSIRNEKLSDDQIVQVFVTDDPTFSEDRATTPHEVLWLIQNGQSKAVLPDGSIADDGGMLDKLSEPFTVHLAVGKDVALIDVAGKRLWAGEDHLNPDRPRFVGVRFLQKGDVKEPQILVQSIRIMKK